jgi:putative hydrolase of the HAD superfamily
MFRLIAFDADDTLWHNERLYTKGRDRFRRLLASYDVHDAIEEYVHQTEMRNIRYYGFGVMSFALSLIEAAIDLTHGRISSGDIGSLLDMGKEMLTADIDLFEGAEEAVAHLSAQYPLMLITKGDLLHQQAKVEQSGLAKYFRHVEVVSDKSEATYRAILSRLHLDPAHFLMVGNSLRSDILPVVRLGGWAVHIPAELSWSYEEAELPGGLHERYFEVRNLGELPGFLESLRNQA